MIEILQRIYDRMEAHKENKHCAFFLASSWNTTSLKNIFESCNIKYIWLHSNETLMLDYNELSLKELKNKIELILIEGDF